MNYSAKNLRDLRIGGFSGYALCANFVECLEAGASLSEKMAYEAVIGLRAGVV